VSVCWRSYEAKGYNQTWLYSSQVTIHQYPTGGDGLSVKTVNLTIFPITSSARLLCWGMQCCKFVYIQIRFRMRLLEQQA